MLAEISLENIKLYAHHGCLTEERLIGSMYRVDLSVFTNIEKASTSDNLNHTVDYVELLDIIKTEMSIPNNLLETVLVRIRNKIFVNIDTVLKIDLRIAKINPPINGDVASVSLRIISER